MAEPLKTVTHQSHQALEGFLIPIIKNTHTVTDYVQLLKMFYGYYQPVEKAIDQFPIIHDLPDYDQRRKSQLMLDDLQSLGDNNSIPICSSVPALTTIEEAYGAMYVLEGSTLGGLIIAKMLQRNLNLPEGKGFAFFSGYGPETASKWAVFIKVLDDYYNKLENSGRMALTATQTFIQLKNWADITYRYERAKEKL